MIPENKPVISVIMPVYNGEKYLQESVESILNQTYNNFELIIINDGSADNTASILQSYRKKDDRVRVVHHKANKGNYPCRNEGMNIARGRYIAVMDADDVAFPQRLQVQHDYMEANPDILASGSDFICYGKPHGRGQRGIAMTPEQVRMALIDNNCFLHPSLIIRYAVMKEIGGYDERYAYSADYDLMCRLILHGKVVNMPDVLMQYRRHPAQISQKHWTVQQEYANEIRRIYQGQESVKKLIASGKNKQPYDMFQQQTNEKKQDLLLRIARHLILYGSFCPNPGLLKGKMGIAIFFYELFKVTGQKVYNDYAGDLIDEIYENMNLYTSPFFSDGLAGIGWGFEYIIRNKFADADADEILGDLDQQVTERDVRMIIDTGLDRGLKGIAYYVTARCANRERHAIRPDFIAGLLESIHVRIPPEDPEGRLLAAQLMSVMEHRSIEQDVMEFLKNIMRNRSVETSFVYDKNRPLGISGSGYAGAGLKILWS